MLLLLLLFQIVEIEKASITSKEILQSALLKLAQTTVGMSINCSLFCRWYCSGEYFDKCISLLQTDPVSLGTILGGAKDCIQEVHHKAEDFVRCYFDTRCRLLVNSKSLVIFDNFLMQMNERRAGEQRRVNRERKVDKLQEQLDASHDNLRDGIEAMDQALAERYEVRLVFRLFCLSLGGAEAGAEALAGALPGAPLGAHCGPPIFRESLVLWRRSPPRLSCLAGLTPSRRTQTPQAERKSASATEGF